MVIMKGTTTKIPPPHHAMGLLKKRLAPSTTNPTMTITNPEFILMFCLLSLLGCRAESLSHQGTSKLPCLSPWRIVIRTSPGSAVLVIYAQAVARARVLTLQNLDTFVDQLDLC
jgi:hypothetical protein